MTKVATNSKFVMACSSPEASLLVAVFQQPKNWAGQSSWCRLCHDFRNKNDVLEGFIQMLVRFRPLCPSGTKSYKRLFPCIFRILILDYC